MAQQKSTQNPLVLLNLYLDKDSGGTLHYGKRAVTFHNVDFTARVKSFGLIDRHIPYPPGPLQVDDATVEVVDTDGQIREFFDAVTPFKRIGEIILVDASDTNQYSQRELPISGWRGDLEVNGPLPDAYWRPIFTGEIVGAVFEPGKVIIKLQEIVSLWLDREIPKLITRDYFANLPDDANELADDYTAPIIFGIVRSYSALNVEPQGVIKCHHVDTVLNWYCVARHECAAIYAVYRKRHLEDKFTLVPGGEWEVVQADKTINGIVYHFTYIHFFNAQERGTVIHAEVNGIPYRFDFDTYTQIGGITQRNAVDSLFNLVYYLLQTEVNAERFDPTSWKATRTAVNGFHCDGAITTSLTAGAAISRLASDFNLDFYQTNQGTIALRYYSPNADESIPIDYNLVAHRSFKPSLPTSLFTRVRYRYAHQNAGLTEYTKSSATGQWGFEETLDNLNDQAELAQTGKLPLIEKVAELFFVRDDADALALMKIRMGYYTLRSYLVELELPAPEVVSYLQLATPISCTHIQGIGAVGVGWVDKLMKVYGISFDLSSYRATIKAVVKVDLGDGAFLASYTGSHPVHGAQVNFPHLAVLVNGTLDPIDPTRVDPDAAANVNLNDVDPAVPDSAEDVSVTLIYGFTEGTATADVDDSLFLPVHFQENQEVTPRNVSGYVIVPGAKRTAQMYVGTLEPDTRPVDLTDADIYRVIFYSTDFDHEYWWVGKGETGTTSGWMVIDQCDGDIRMRKYAPLANRGWHLCDGSVNIRFSDYKGDTALATVPLLTGGTYMKGMTAYDGPNPTAAVGHTHPGSTVASHTHSIPGLFVSGLSFSASGTSGAGTAHTHDKTLTNTNTSLDTTAVTITGGTASDGSHDHSGHTNNNVADGSHVHTGATTDLTDPAYVAHVHTSPGGSTGSNSSGHSHTFSGTTTGDTSSAEVEAFIESPELVSDRGHDHGYSGSTGDESSGHTHAFTSPGDTGSAEYVATEGPVTVPGTDSDHVHGISSTGSTHSHSITTLTMKNNDLWTATVGHTTLTIDTESAHTHSISLSGTTGSGTTSGGTSGSTAPGLTIVSDNTPEPKHMGVLPYIRL